MRHAQVGDTSGSSTEVRIAAAMVGVGAIPGALLLGAAGLSFTADPGFLFAVLPFIIGGALMVGLYLIVGSVLLSTQLLRHVPGARIKTLTIGGSLVLAGLVCCTVDPRMGLPIACYGGVLFWLMTTPAAGHDLGEWIPPRKTRPPRATPWDRFFPQPTRPQATPPQQPFFTGAEPPNGGPPPYFTGFELPRKRQRPDTWMELWQEGLGRIPVADLIVLVIGLVAFVVGDVLMFVSLVGGHHGGVPLALLLIGGAIAVHVVLERRMLTRLGYA
jgi:hypothetical protein